ncbi:hypothetical protein GUJ93_ZPchr0013g34274 [Zizania palustris]|uniref:Uncharacterized protein n=1 Tax=Zizania palustris TaxID=103762 RepID=A0A8J5WVW6_ZIZPA|nr:hypothetical protein GUJ93_ZPchr0013g34274 [Zizania palustris]
MSGWGGEARCVRRRRNPFLFRCLLAAAPAEFFLFFRSFLLFSFRFLARTARALKPASMGDASETTSAPDTPSTTLICREDGTKLFSADADDGDGAELSVLAGDKHLLVMERNDEYIAFMLSRERGAGSDSGEPEEEVEDWMKDARAECVGWIVKL